MMNPTHLLRKLLFGALLLCFVKQATAQCIDFPETANLSLVLVTPSCHNERNGKISVQCDSRFKQRHEFSIDDKNYSSATSFTDLRADSYTIYAKAKNDTIVYCRQIELKEPAKLNISINERKGETCFNTNDCEIGYSIGGGTPPYTVRLINVDRQDEQKHKIEKPGNDLFSELSPALYFFEAIDSNGCVSEKITIFLKKAERLIWNEPIISNETDLDKRNGSAIINISGGSAPLNYMLENSDSVVYKGSDNRISGLGYGSYKLLVTDRNGCPLAQSIKVGSDIDLSTQNLQSKSKELLVSAQTLLIDNKSQLKSKKKTHNVARFSTQFVSVAGGVLSLLVPDKSKGIVAGISAGSTAVLDLFTDMVKLEKEIDTRKKINKDLNDQIQAFQKAWPPEKFNKPEFTSEEYKRFLTDMQLLRSVVSVCSVFIENIEQQSK
ncbi:MAG: hypothetical protein ACRC3B_23380 [Bacteroidia bacterium]